MLVVLVDFCFENVLVPGTVLVPGSQGRLIFLRSFKDGLLYWYQVLDQLVPGTTVPGVVIHVL